MRNTITLLIFMIFSLSLNAQNIEFTFANAQTTNDGANDFYEVDVMIATVDGQPDFKLGAGLIYINYNTVAFGDNIVSNGKATVSKTNPDYILADNNGLDYYTTFNLADNDDFRIAYSYIQFLSSGGMVANVNSVPKKLFHLKIQFMNSSMDPMVVFEDDETPSGVAECRDQFRTACGPSANLAGADCGSEPGVQFIDALFNSGGATLSIDKPEILNTLSIYPNPTKDLLYVDVNVKSKYRFIDMFGKIVKTGSFDQGKNELQLRKYEVGVYFLRVINGSKIITKKIVLE